MSTPASFSTNGEGGRPDVTVIFVNWNALPDTRRALESFREHPSRVACEFLVIDNASSVETDFASFQRDFPEARVVLNAENLGFGAACNQGAKLARGRYLLLLNTDTLQIEDAVGAAVAYLDGHPDVGALGIQHLNDDAERTAQPSAFPFFEAWPAIDGMLRGPVAFRDYEHPRSEQDVDWLCGSFFMVPCAVWDEVGGFDERYFVYFEDMDLCLRLWRAGHRVRFWPGARMIHKGSAAAIFIADKSYIMLRSEVAYLAKNHAPWVAPLFYLAASLRLSLGVVKGAVELAQGNETAAGLRKRARRALGFVLARSPRAGL